MVHGSAVGPRPCRIFLQNCLEVGNDGVALIRLQKFSNVSSIVSSYSNVKAQS